jgi:hypothetical protein
MLIDLFYVGNNEQELKIKVDMTHFTWVIGLQVIYYFEFTNFVEQRTS